MGKRLVAGVALALALALGLCAGCSAEDGSQGNAASSNANANTSQSAASNANANKNSAANESKVPDSVDVDTASVRMLLPYVEDGAYRGTAEGYGGYITVRVEVKNHHMTNIECIEQSESATSGRWPSRSCR